MSTSADVGDVHINGTIAVTVAGTVTGVVRGPSWREVNIQTSTGPALLRFYDASPMELGDLTEGELGVIMPEPVEGEPPGGES